MFVIVCYDVMAKRDKHVRKVLLKYLRPAQRSVMEGFLTQGMLNRLRSDLQPCIDTEYDAVHIYCIHYENAFSIEKIGQCGEGLSGIL